MGVFLILGIVGLALLVTVVVFGDILHALLPDVELGDGLFSLPVLAGFTAAFGFAGAALNSATNGSVLASVAGGGGAGVGVGWITLRLSRGLMRMRTDEPVRTADLVGRQGHVVTPIREGRLGEVLVLHAGQSLKLSARADRPLERGAAIVVVESISPTAVLVTAEADFWGSIDSDAAQEPR